MRNVKAEKRPAWANRLPASYKRRLARAGITHEQVALASAPGYRKRPIERQFVTAVLNGVSACPAWLRGLMDELLAAG